ASGPYTNDFAYEVDLAAQVDDDSRLVAVIGKTRLVFDSVCLSDHGGAVTLSNSPNSLKWRKMPLPTKPLQDTTPNPDFDLYYKQLTKGSKDYCEPDIGPIHKDNVGPWCIPPVSQY